MLKRDHLLRFPHPSPCQARGRLIAAYTQVRLIPQDFWGSRKQDFAHSTCICLPARSRFGEGRALSKQPGKGYFFSSLFIIHSYSRVFSSQQMPSYLLSGLSCRINKNSLWDNLNLYNGKGNSLSRKINHRIWECPPHLFGRRPSNG